MSKVIVFGPTGQVGSATALAAKEKGAEVFLAMRNTSKPTPRIDSSFPKIQADLSKPDTIREAVTKTGAKYAFVYLIFGNNDGMKSAIEALKSAGIEYVVFLSSYSIQADDLKSVPPSDIIPYAHAQVELNLEEVFGPQGYVTVRPAYFASNTVMHWKKGVQDGDVKTLLPDMKWDWIVPEDIGRVCGAILAGGPKAADGHKIIFLCGPELRTQRDVVGAMGKGLGRELKITEINEQEYIDMFVKQGLPPPLANHLVQGMKKQHEEGYAEGRYQEAVSNIEKYGGSKPSTFEEWLAENKGDFDS
jgi:uncharacterized protein YbjT (DUF2867 family)